MAVDLPSHEAFEKLYEGLKTAGNGLKPVRPGNQHLTLKFVGEPPCTVEEINNVGESATSNHSAFRMGIGTSGAFPNWYRPKVLWIGLEGENRLKELADDMDRQLNRLCGIKTERREFRAHITAARVRESRKTDLTQAKQALEKCVDELLRDGYSIHVEEIHLFNSTLIPTGPIYEKIKTFKLGFG
ncbi:MAG: RNA 2',3'-cyclic phosphodiesterase [Thermoplasmatota archaeon]